jgi:hypothetical protein
MSPTGVRKFSDVALVRPAGNPIEPALVGDSTPVRVGAIGENALDTASQPLRPAAPARVGPSWRLDPHPYEDPCNYLG